MPATSANCSTASRTREIGAYHGDRTCDTLGVTFGDSEASDGSAMPTGQQPEVKLPHQLCLQHRQRSWPVEEAHQSKRCVNYFGFGRIYADGRARRQGRRPHFQHQVGNHRSIEVYDQREVRLCDGRARNLAYRRHIRSDQQGFAGPEVERVTPHRYPLGALKYQRHKRLGDVAGVGVVSRRIVRPGIGV